MLRCSRTKRSSTAALRRFYRPRTGCGITRASCSTRRTTETYLRPPSRRNITAPLTERLANRCAAVVVVVVVVVVVGEVAHLIWAKAQYCCWCDRHGVSWQDACCCYQEPCCCVSQSNQQQSVLAKEAAACLREGRPWSTTVHVRCTSNKVDFMGLLPSTFFEKMSEAFSASNGS